MVFIRYSCRPGRAERPTSAANLLNGSFPQLQQTREREQEIGTYDSGPQCGFYTPAFLTARTRFRELCGALKKFVEQCPGIWPEVLLEFPSCLSFPDSSAGGRTVYTLFGGVLNSENTFGRLRRVLLPGVTKGTGQNFCT
jgi:hypothetical protein